MGLGTFFLIKQRYKPVSHCTLGRGLTNRNRWSSLQGRDGATFDFWFCRFHCVLHRGYVSSVASAVSPALQLHMLSNHRFHNPVRAWVDWLCEVANINENAFGFTLQQVDTKSNSFLVIVRQSISLSSYQLPLKIIVGWILIDLFHLTLSLKILWYWRLSYLDLNMFQRGIFPL